MVNGPEHRPLRVRVNYSLPYYWWWCPCFAKGWEIQTLIFCGRFSVLFFNHHFFANCFSTVILDKYNLKKEREITHWSYFQCLFSTPVWLTLMRSTARRRSSGFRNHAFVGESGNRNQNAIAVRSVMIPVMIMSLNKGVNLKWKWIS